MRRVHARGGMWKEHVIIDLEKECPSNCSQPCRDMTASVFWVRGLKVCVTIAWPAFKSFCSLEFPWTPFPNWSYFCRLLYSLWHDGVPCNLCFRTSLRAWHSKTHRSHLSLKGLSRMQGPSLPIPPSPSVGTIRKFSLCTRPCVVLGIQCRHIVLIVNDI